jgi:exodeoxyribonuclease VII large subunit
VLETNPEHPISVKEASLLVGQWISRMGDVWVEGELSEIKVRPGAGTVFMDLRDTSDDYRISLKIFTNYFKTLGEIKKNARVIVNLSPDYYAKTGSLNYLVHELHQVGIGELMARIEALKNKLSSEGLFDPARKKAIPFLPRKVGVICGRNSDAEKDVVENAKRRWPAVQFSIKEVAVQGAAAVSEVSKALKQLEKDPLVDVIVITRGGGSFEDLLPFSDESLLRLVSDCVKPVISAIGHEKDQPLLDLVADWRASTPTDAGKKVVPDFEVEVAVINHLRTRALDSLERRFIRESEKITSLISNSLTNLTHKTTLAYSVIEQLISTLRALSPQKTLDRGYAVVTQENGKILRDADNSTVGEELSIKVAKGEILATSKGKA